MRRRILHISTRLILGGSQENTVLSCEGQADAGHEVGLVHGPIFGPEGSLAERVRRHGGVELIETPHLVRPVRPWHDARCRVDLARIIRDWAPDVVHTHSSKAGILGRWAAWSERVRAVIHTIHGLPFHPYQGRVARTAYIRAERWAARRCHAIAVVADAMREQALAAGVGRPEQFEVVYSGMEVGPFLDDGLDGSTDRLAVRSALGLPHDAFVVGTIARLAELKGHDDLLDALATSLAERPSLHLLWIGDGWHRDRLMTRVRSAGLEQRVIAPGRVEPDRIPEMIRAMDALVHPSYREGLPRAVVQSLLSARPAVAYDCDGAREVCVDGLTGRLVAPGDLDGLRDAVLWLMDHPDAARELGLRGRDLCRDRFDTRTMVRHLLELYESVLERRFPRSSA